MFLMQWSGASHTELAMLSPQWQLLKRGCSDLMLTKTSLAFQHDPETWMLLLPVPWESWLSHFPYCCLHNRWPEPLSSGHRASAARQGLHTDVHEGTALATQTRLQQGQQSSLSPHKGGLSYCYTAELTANVKSACKALQFGGRWPNTNHVAASS